MTADDRQQEKYQRMLTWPLPKLILSLSLPMIASNLITSLYNMADTYFVGQIGESAAATSATGAIGVAYALQVLIQAIGFSFGNGTSNNVARLLGAKRYNEAEMYATTGLITAMLSGVLFGTLCILFRIPIARFLGATETILPYAVEYICYIMLAAPFMVGSFCLNTLLRAQGSVVHAMCGLMAGGIVNVILDPILIFGADMGVAGAALATCMSQIIGFCVLFVMHSRRCGNLGIQISNFRPSAERYRNIFKLGIPSLFRQGVSSVASIVLNNIAAPFGDAAIAAMAVVVRITQAVYSVMVGFGNGFLPVCGHNYGSKHYQRLRKGYLFSLCVTTAWLVFIATVIFIFAPTIVALFRGDDAEVIRIGAVALRYQCLSMPALGVFLLFNTTSQALGFSVQSTIVATSRQGLFFVPIIYLLTNLFGLTGVQLAQPISDVCSLIITIPMTIRLLRSLNIPDGAEHSFRKASRN